MTSNKPKKSQSLKKALVKGTPSGLIQDAFTDIEGLKDEMEEWKESLEGANLEHLPKYEEVEQAVECLDQATQEDFSDTIKVIEDRFDEQLGTIETIVMHPRRRYATRAIRLALAVGPAEQVIETIEAKLDEDNQADAEFQVQLDEIKDALESANEVDFPSMY